MRPDMLRGIVPKFPAGKKGQTADDVRERNDVHNWIRAHTATKRYIRRHTHINLLGTLSQGLYKVPGTLYMYVYVFIHIHTHTYRSVQYILIHTYTYTYTPPSHRVGWVFAVQRGQRPLENPWRGAAPQDQLGWDLRRDRRMHTAQGVAYWRHPGLALGPPNARGCAKTGPGVGPRWREKVVGHLPRGALSGARGGAAPAGGLLSGHWGAIG